jgi:hypothetical protein
MAGSRITDAVCAPLDTGAFKGLHDTVFWKLREDSWLKKG